MKSSSYQVGHAQANGERFVVETHITDAGETIEYRYGPVDDKTDFDALRDFHAAAIDRAITEAAETAARQSATEKRISTALLEAVDAGRIELAEAEHYCPVGKYRVQPAIGERSRG